MKIVKRIAKLVTVSMCTVMLAVPWTAGRATGISPSAGGYTWSYDLEANTWTLVYPGQ